MAKNKLVIFDWDGVLVNTVNMDYEIYKIIGDKLGKKIPPSTDEFGKLTNGRWQMLHKNLGITTDEEVMTSVRMYMELRMRMEGDVEAYPGIKEVLSFLKGERKKIAIISNNFRENIVRLMERLGFDKYIETVIAYDPQKKSKPHPDQILECMRKLGVKPNETAFVGDMEVDMAAGKAAKVRTIGVTYGWHKRERLEKFEPFVVVDSPMEILENLEN